MGLATNEVENGTDGELERGSSARLRVGAVVANTFRIVRHVGSGGSSHVFEAEHLRLGKRFALKLLRPELDPNRRAAQRFRREARAIARLKSEHIVSVVDCGELDDGTPYLVMELLEGEDLRSLLKREGALPERRTVALLIEACRGLTVVHTAGLVHRDLKPENLFVTRRSTGEDWCKVLDFGVAKMESSLSTAENAIVGTARYMAPEQLADSAAVGPATDVYALGAILYECASGHAVVSGGTVQEVMYRIMNAEPASLSQLAPTASRALVDVIERCLSKSPAARPSSTDELAALLQAAISGSSRDRMNNATVAEDDEAPKHAGRRRYALPLIVAGALAATVVIAYTDWYARGVSIAKETDRLSPPTMRNVASPPEETAASAGMPLATPQLRASVTGASTNPSSAAAQIPSSTKPATLSPRLATPARSRARPANAFDSANPYAE